MTDATPPPSHSPAALTRANDFIAVELKNRLELIESESKSHALCMKGPLYTGVDDIVRDLLERRKGEEPSQDRLTVLLTSTGGQVEPVVRVFEVMRHHYGHVSFIVPNFAYSAGTILAMSGDQIIMDYYSRLGPIDPQVRNRYGQFVPALGYLQRWDEMLGKAQKGEITTAEIQVMLSFDQAELYMYEQAKEQSIDLLIEWLHQYKFKNWVETESQKTPVTDAMRRERAEEIARVLSDSDRWHSHGRGISKEVLEKEVGLRVDDLADYPVLYKRIKEYDHLLSDFMSVRDSEIAFQVISSSLVIA